MFQGIIFAISAVLLLVTFLIFKGKGGKKFQTVMKVAVLVYFTLAFFRGMLSDSFIFIIKRGIFEKTHYTSTDYIQSILRWGHFTSYVVLIMAVFFDSRLFKNLAIFFSLPFTVVSVFYFDSFMTYFMSELGRGYSTPLWFRQAFFCIELIIAITLPLMFIVGEKHYFKVKDKKEWINFFCALIPIAIALVPVYIPQSLFGYTRITIKTFSVANFAWLALTALEVYVLFMLFRFKDKRQRYMLCMFLALALFVHYNQLFLMGFTIKRLPIQLCNLGAYFFVIALIIKNRAFFNFAFLANVMGTIIAMVMPEMDPQGFAFFWNYHYIVEHMQVFVVPVLCMLLRIFPRLEKNALKHLVIGFSAYFLFCWITGTLLNGLGTEQVNFFFIFDTKKAVENFAFLSFMYDFEMVLFNRFKLNLPFQLMIYCVFLFLCLLLYLAVMKFYDMLDDQFRLRRARIDLYEKVTGKKSRRQRDFTD